MSIYSFDLYNLTERVFAIMKPLSSRTSDFTDSVIRRMTRISNQYQAVNLSQGFPDFDPPKEILNRLKQVTDENFHQYSIT